MQVAFAESLLKRHLLGAAQDLKDVCQGKATSKGPEKEVVQTILHRVYACLSGVQTSLPGFEHAASELPGQDISVKAQVSSWSYISKNHSICIQ